MPAVVLDRTTNAARPFVVFCGLDVCRTVLFPLIRPKFTEYTPVVTTLPKTSTTLTTPPDVAVLSGGMGVGENAQVR